MGGDVRAGEAWHTNKLGQICEEWEPSTTVGKSEQQSEGRACGDDIHVSEYGGESTGPPAT